MADLTARLLEPRRAAQGIVVMIDSGSGHVSYPNGAVYTGTKFALRTMADCLREEERENGVRVTSVHPGFVATDMGHRIREESGRAGGAGHLRRPRNDCCGGTAGGGNARQCSSRDNLDPSDAQTRERVTSPHRFQTTHAADPFVRSGSSGVGTDLLDHGPVMPSGHQLHHLLRTEPSRVLCRSGRGRLF